MLRFAGLPPISEIWVPQKTAHLGKLLCILPTRMLRGVIKPDKAKLMVIFYPIVGQSQKNIKIKENALPKSKKLH